jgi:outer membrane receptor protein involved in Fe transport
MSRAVAISFLLMCLNCACFAQQEINGVIKDKSTNGVLIGVNIVIKETGENTVTDVNGNFKLITKSHLPVTLTISYIGYNEVQIVVNKTKPLYIQLSAKDANLKEVNVTGSRITEKQKQSPLTVENLDRIGIKEMPTPDFYEGLGELSGVDVASASFGFKVINTRGFTSTSPVRSLQLIDGVDNQSPGLNFSLGNFLGASELDVQNVELILGASSAYYGPNAFNGVISMTTRSPFTNPGLDVSVKTGERNLLETAIRWADYFKNKKGEQKFGYKLNLYYMKALDWTANNLAATPQSLSDTKNPGGYDAVNVYGDEYQRGSDYTKDAGAFPGLGVFYRKGYAEQDLVDYNTWNTKASASFFYKINPKTEIVAASSLGAGSTIYQGDDRFALKNILFFQNRLEIKQEGKWFLRVYATNENSGDSYDAYFTALILQQEAQSISSWKVAYENYWNDHYNLNYVKNLPGFPPPPKPGPAYAAWLNEINPFLYNNYYDSLVAWHKAAQANMPYFEPGTYTFDTAFAGITSRNTNNGIQGTHIYDRSALYHAQGEYKFDIPFCNVTAGGNMRIYAPDSKGTIFSDTGGTSIRNVEFGVYAGAEKKVMSDKLKIDVTVRLDKNENFPFLFSPAASFVYTLAPENYVRTSFSSAIRNPTLTDQYYYYNTGNAILTGNIKGFNNLVTIPSLGSAFSGQSFDSLSYFNIKPVRPEEVKTIECGYRGIVLKNLYIDMDAYYSWYKYFIGYKIGAAVDTGHHFGAPEITVSNIYRVATNSMDEVTTSGLSLALNYYLGKYLAITGNYSWNLLDRHGSTDTLIPAYNTPENKFNIGVNARDIHHFGFNLNYRWVDGYTFEGSPQFTGPIPSYGVVDVQVNRKFPKYHSTIKIGASNVLNNMHYEVYGGPLAGRLVYISLLYESKK